MLETLARKCGLNGQYYLSAVLWKQKMTCPMDGLSMSGCNCSIKVWSNKKMFVVQRQIYHIDQHINRIVCEYVWDCVLCHYMTDREADLKLHISKVHAEKLKVMIDSHLYINENPWLDLTSSWSIKDIAKKYRTFPELSYTASASRLLVWVIMDL